MAQVSQINGHTLVDTVARQSIEGKQDKLVSGTNLKTVNGTTLLGSGNIVAGLVDDIKINGTSVVANKIANIVIKETLATDSSDPATVTAIRDYVNSSINALASYYITADASGNAFATKAALTGASKYYYDGAVRTITKNDYAIVTADETHDNKSARYMYTGTQWAFQYTFQMSFTAAQLSALNSGITTAAVSLYNTHVAKTDNPHSVTKSQVGLSNVANERQYSSANPPPYPVTSVAGKTGAVTLTNTDVGLSNVGNYKAVSTVVNQGLTNPEKTAARNNIGAYALPADGIPEASLAEAVQTKLSHAETAYDDVGMVTMCIPQGTSSSNPLVNQADLNNALPTTVGTTLTQLGDGTYNLTFTLS